MPQDGHAYTRTATQPKDLEEANPEDTIDHDSLSSPRQPRFRATRPAHQRGNSQPENDTERGRGRSRDTSRTSSRVRDGGTRTPRATSTTGVSRPLTPIATSPLLGPVPISPDASYRSLGVQPSTAEGMRRTKSSDGYGSTGSTVPSPVPRSERLRDQDVSPLPGHNEDDDEQISSSVDLDITPRLADVSRIPGPAMAFPSRIDDRVRIQARRSLSSEEPHHRTGRMGGHGGGSRQGAKAGNVVMLDDV